jgi:biopolymer transport protein ExbB/TolQ
MSNLQLSWNKLDFERKFAFDSKKYTGVNALFSFILAIVFSGAFYGALYGFSQFGEFAKINMFFHGGPENRSTIPYFIVFLSSWSMAIVFIKSRKLKLQKKALNLDIVPQDVDFVLAPNSASQIMNEMYEKVDDPLKFLLLNRIARSISNLKNIGRISDVAEGLGAQAENDENYLESTYTLLKGFIWAIPVLGFIGTVLGLSEAIGGFGKVVSAGASMEELKHALSGVTAGLAIAFETTLIALVFALVIQLILTMLKKKEEDFLDECSDYCHKNIISKLKTVGLRDEYDYDNK